MTTTTTMRGDAARNRTRRRAGGLLATVVLAAAAAAVAAGGPAGAGSGEPFTLRVAMTSPSEPMIAVWEAAADAFEEANEGVTVEFIRQDDDLYETIGLPTLLTSGNPPDVYFEWAGARVEERYEQGFVLDLTSAVAESELAELFDDSAFNSMTVDGKIVMVPDDADVTNVIWYNVDLFDELGITPPTTWDEFLALCPTIADEGLIPLAIGNKDLWAGGNFASHIVSRVIGAEAYDQLMREELPMDAPEVVEGLGYVQQLFEAGCVNESVNALADNEGAQLFFQGLAAMHPIGSWIVARALDEAPDLNFDYFNLPPLPDLEQQDSVIGLATGFIVNAHSEHPDAAIEFLTLWSSPEFTAQRVEAGTTPMARGAMDREDIDERLTRLMADLNGASTVIAPPDTGYELRVADALYGAEAEILGGQADAAEAAASAAARLEQ
jgi:raffinose/stachyose/melibiose transport system substrate-binding protein